MAVVTNSILDLETPIHLFAKQTGIELSADDMLVSDEPQIREPWIKRSITWQKSQAGWQLARRQRRFPVPSLWLTRFVFLHLGFFFVGLYILSFLTQELVESYFRVAVPEEPFRLGLGVIGLAVYVAIARPDWIFRRAAVSDVRLGFDPDSDKVKLLSGDRQIERRDISYFAVIASLTRRSYIRQLAGPVPLLEQWELRTEWQVIYEQNGSRHRQTLAYGESSVEGSPTAMTDAISDVFAMKAMGAHLQVPVVIVKFEVLQKKFFVRLFE